MSWVRLLPTAGFFTFFYLIQEADKCNTHLVSCPNPDFSERGLGMRLIILIINVHYSSLVPRSLYENRGLGTSLAVLMDFLKTLFISAFIFLLVVVSLQSWGDGPFPASTEAVGLQLSNCAWNGVPVSEGVCPPTCL